jgi:hypothetical protein
MEQKMTQSANDPLSYAFTYRRETDAVAHGIFKYMTVMRIDGASFRAIMVSNRRNGDFSGSVGLFAATLPRQMVLDLGAAMDSTKWADLPPPTGGDISSSTLSLDYTHGSRIVQRTFNSMNRGFLHAISSVVTQIGKLDDMLSTKPERALDVDVARTDTGFKLILRCIGTGPVMIADPRLAGKTLDKARGVIEVAARQEERPGYFTPPATWTAVALKPLGSSGESITIEPGKAFEVETVAWTPPAPGDYSVEGSWTDYVGPTVDPHSIMPMVPDPTAAHPDGRPYVIRGAAFSKTLKFTVEKQHRPRPQPRR